MPLIKKSTYPGRPFYLFNYHLETVYASKFRKVSQVSYQRERLNLWDGDFLDLDWVQNGHKRIVILSHGLEGHAYRPYMLGGVKQFSLLGWDALSWNCRSCSGEMNRLPRLYHHGVSEDLRAVIQYVLKKGKYEEVILMGYSMGGNITLKYLGEEAANLDERIRAAVVYSVPCDLNASIDTIHKPKNRFYKNHFLRKLRRKIRKKAQQFPELLDVTGIDEIDNFIDFDNRFSAPLHGFMDARDFYSRISAYPWLNKIQIPTLLVNSKNDPILDGLCYPEQLARQHPYLYLEMPKYGGHVGFTLPFKELSWADQRAVEFIEQYR